MHVVNPGWGGQPFIDGSPDEAPPPCRAAPEALHEVDGGVDPTTASSVADAGATLLVAGSAIFGRPDPAAAYAELAGAAGAA